MNWQPDLTPLEFQIVLDSPILWGSCFLNPPVNPRRANELNPDAWYIDDRKEYYVFIPWKRITGPEGYKVFGQAIKAHDTHLLVKKYLHPQHDSILDVGGYDGIWAWLYGQGRRVVLDVCQEALERWAAIHAEIVCRDGKDIGKLFQPNEFDIVFLLDVLEHMKATSALACIKAAEKIAKHQVIVATPDGYQPFDDWQSMLTPGADIPCTELMAHKSGWGHEFFEDRGYKVTIQSGLHGDIGLGDGLVAFLNK